MGATIGESTGKLGQVPFHSYRSLVALNWRVSGFGKGGGVQRFTRGITEDEGKTKTKTNWVVHLTLLSWTQSSFRIRFRQCLI